MAIQNITTNYTNRKKDISIFYAGLDAKKVGAQPVTPAFGKVSAFCAGVQKLVQRYAILLLTQLGSQELYPSFGTELITRLQGGVSLLKSDITHLFNFANMKVLTELRRYQQTRSEDPDDEAIDTAILENITVTAGNVQFFVKIYTRAGEIIDFVVPLPKQN